MNELSEFAYSREEAEKLGYDPAIVEFFQKKYPDLLKVMWGSDSLHYQEILNNLITDEDLEKSLAWFDLFPDPHGMLLTLAMIEFRGIEKGKYVGKPLPRKAEMVDMFFGYNVFVIGQIVLLVHSYDGDRIVTHQYSFDSEKEPLKENECFVKKETGIRKEGVEDFQVIEALVDTSSGMSFIDLDKRVSLVRGGEETQIIVKTDSISEVSGWVEYKVKRSVRGPYWETMTDKNGNCQISIRIPNKKATNGKLVVCVKPDEKQMYFFNIECDLY